MQEAPPPESSLGSSAMSTSHTAAPVRKRQLFKNRTAGAAKSTLQKKPPAEDEDDDPLAAFNRSNDTFRLIQEEEARVQKEKDLAAREKAEYERLRQERLQLNLEPKQKKLRLSDVDEDGTEGLYSEERPVSIARERESADVNGLTTPPRSRSDEHSTTPRSSARRRGLRIEPEENGSPLGGRFNLDNVNSDENVHEQNVDSSHDTKNNDSHSSAMIPATQPILLDDSDDPDSLDNNLRASRAPSQSTHLAPPKPVTASQARSTQSVTPIPEAPSPVLSLLIHSPLPDTTPLMVKRRLNQRLKEVRVAWIKKQQGVGALPADLDMTTIFLTWRDKRLFDFTTCKSLGVTLDELTGEVVHKSTGGSGMTGREEREWAQAGVGTQMVFEAVTEQILEERRNPPKAAAAQHLSTTGLDASNVDRDDMVSDRPRHASTKPEQQQDAETEESIRIILRAGKEYPNYKLTVRKVSTAIFCTTIFCTTIFCTTIFCTTIFC